MARKTETHRGLPVWGRRFVQASFLALFLFPLAVTVYGKASLQTAPVFTSWLLAWDPALLAGQVAHRAFSSIVIGAPLLLLALTLVFGRFFCSWACPVGAVADLVRWLAFWRRAKRNTSSQRGNWLLRYFLLAFILAASLFSLKYLGLFDPLVVFSRSSSTLAANFFSARQPGIRAALALVSTVFLGIIGLELWRPRFWCRNLCPLGALLSLISRFSLLRRTVPVGCTRCGACERSCPMNAIGERGDSTNYSDCIFCLECAAACPQDGIEFTFRPAPQRMSDAIAKPAQPERRRFLGAVAATAAGVAILPLAGLVSKQNVLRPPGALPEEEFLRACILCQECVRACPTGALRPAFLGGGLAGIGTPVLVPRQGGCALNPSCPDLCAAACPVGAIRPVPREKMKIGLAVVRREACLAWDQGAKCLVCVEACLNSAAIAFNGRVTVDPTRCTGCGRCEAGCPVPGGAIRVEPLAERLMG